MNRLSSIAILVLCVSIIGCAAKPVKTSGKVSPEKQVASVQVSLELMDADKINITRQVPGY